MDLARNKEVLVACGILALMLVLLVSGCTKKQVVHEPPKDLATPVLNNTAVLDVLGVT